MYKGLNVNSIMDDERLNKTDSNTIDGNTIDSNTIDGNTIDSD